MQQFFIKSEVTSALTQIFEALNRVFDALRSYKIKLHKMLP